MPRVNDTPLGTVYIAGAGPGDPDLLTVKAMRVLQNAGVVLYDRLVHEQILSLVPSDCLQVYVGKQDRKHLIPQDRINELLGEYAETHEVVVRLKGGDPFLFGRGAEEALYLAAHDVPYEIIPGVTSALGVPAYAGIPVTHRGVASHCTVVTGHLSSATASSLPWHSFIHQGTLLFLMAIAGRQQIAQQLIAHGRPPAEPVAFVERGTTEHQQVWTGTLQELATHPPTIQSPAILIVGKVVRLREQLDWFQPSTIATHTNNAEDGQPQVLTFPATPPRSSS